MEDKYVEWLHKWSEEKLTFRNHQARILRDILFLSIALGFVHLTNSLRFFRDFFLLPQQVLYYLNLVLIQMV